MSTEKVLLGLILLAAIIAACIIIINLEEFETKITADREITSNYVYRVVEFDDDCRKPYVFDPATVSITKKNNSLISKQLEVWQPDKICFVMEQNNQKYFVNGPYGRLEFIGFEPNLPNGVSNPIGQIGTMADIPPGKAVSIHYQIQPNCIGENYRKNGGSAPYQYFEQEKTAFESITGIAILPGNVECGTITRLVPGSNPIKIIPVLKK